MGCGSAGSGPGAAPGAGGGGSGGEAAAGGTGGSDASSPAEAAADSIGSDATDVAAPGGVPLDPALLAMCAGANPIRCMIPLPSNGNYDVTVELGDPGGAAATPRVQAELLRIVVPTL